MVTDGLVDVIDNHDEDFGLSRLEQVLIEHATQPLSRIWELVMEAVRHHGPQRDDQTLLLVRVRE